eukprot:1465121-Lingulodinium_polyedra.AAC.1
MTVPLRGFGGMANGGAPVVRSFPSAARAGPRSMFGGRRRSILSCRPSRAPRGRTIGCDSPDSGCVR